MFSALAWLMIACGDSRMSLIERSTLVRLTPTRSDPATRVTSFNGPTTSPRFAHDPVWMWVGCGTLVMSPMLGSADGDADWAATVAATARDRTTADPAATLNFMPGHLHAIWAG